MRRHTRVLTIVLVCVGAAAAPPVFAGGRGVAAGQDAATEAMMKAAQPGAEHKGLEALVGTWSATTKVWMAPGQEPLAAKATSVNTPTLGGRFVAQDYSGDFMGAPFNGHGLTGYDNVIKKYVLTWVDNMSTGIMRLEGTLDPKTNTYTFDGPNSDPVSNAAKPARMTLRIVSPTEHVMEWFDPGPDGKWVRIMEITYTKK